MAREVVVLCDKCGEPGAEGYRITLPDGQTVELDLDEQHAKPLKQLALLGRKAGNPKVRSIRDRGLSSLDARWRNVPERKSADGG